MADEKTLEQVKQMSLFVLKHEPKHLDWLDAFLQVNGATKEQCKDSFNQLINEGKIELSMYKVKLK